MLDSESSWPSALLKAKRWLLQYNSRVASLGTKFDDRTWASVKEIVGMLKKVRVHFPMG